MKKLMFLILLLLGSDLAHAQTFKATTEEEYNMGTVGYKMYLTMGVQMKTGYSVEPFTTFEYGERKAEFKGLFRPGDKKPCAILLIYSKQRGAPEYYCIPTLDAPEILWDRYRTSLGGEIDQKQEQVEFFGFALAKAAMYFSNKE
jgi:hypothetical protein